MHAEPPGDEPSRLNHAIITQRPTESFAKPHLRAWLVTWLLKNFRSGDSVVVDSNEVIVGDQQIEFPKKRAFLQ